MKRSLYFLMFLSIPFFSCKKEEPKSPQPSHIIPVADMSIESDAVTSYQINFINKSTNATSYKWYFGDGDSSDLANPIHQYYIKQTYTVTLIAKNGDQQHTITKLLVVGDHNVGKPDFTYALECGYPFKVNFKLNIPDGQIEKIEWNFGDNKISEAIAPAHIYSTAYTRNAVKVSATITINNDQFYIEKPVHIGLLITEKIVKSCYYTHVIERGYVGQPIEKYSIETIEVKQIPNTTDIEFWGKTLTYQGGLMYTTSYITPDGTSVYQSFTYIFPDSCEVFSRAEFPNHFFVNRSGKGEKLY